MPGSAAVCTGVVKIYWTGTGEVHALKGVDATFPAEAVTAVVGPSGSGKSSLLRILACIDRPTAGQVRIGSDEVAGLSPRKRRHVRRESIGYVFQRPGDNLIGYLTARQHLQLSARLRGQKIGDNGDWLLDRLGLGGRADHRPHQLSGGEQQRLAFASAVAASPTLIVADEPTAELDSASARNLMETVMALREMGIAFAMATHDPLVVEMSDQTLYLRHGALEAEAVRDRLLSVIDQAGRIQLPPHALKLFPDRRAVIEVGEDGVRIDPP